MSLITDQPPRPLKIAVIGTGIAGLSAGWLLAQGGHRITFFEKEDRPGGHANTVDAGDSGPVDTGFIVYNEPCYPNLVALFKHLNVQTRPTDMSFGVSLDQGRVEYSGTGLDGLFAQRRNLFNPTFLRMVRDTMRFYRDAPALLNRADAETYSLGAFLDEGKYSDTFVRDHLLPMAAAIWSAPLDTMRAHPAAAFLRFCENHGLLKVRDRPVWRTVEGGSRAYVRRIIEDTPGALHLNAAIAHIRREPGAAQGAVVVRDRAGIERRFDHVVLGAHADQSLAMLGDADEMERRLLGAFGYQRNMAFLHTDKNLMPKRRKVWSSWNYLAERDGGRNRDGQGDESAVCVTYWMNRLQTFLPENRDLFVTLNPINAPAEGSILRSFLYDHPVFDLAALQAQKEMWQVQGGRNTWFCGSYFGAGFHEDGLQSGLAVAEALGGVRRPWQVAEESGRICLSPSGSFLPQQLQVAQ